MMDMLLFTADVVYHDHNGVNRTSTTVEAYTAHGAILAIKEDLRKQGKSRIKVRTPMPNKWRMAG